MRRRSPQGECGLKFDRVPAQLVHTGRSPQGECGLKLHDAAIAVLSGESLPARGVWIEIGRFR